MRILLPLVRTTLLWCMALLLPSCVESYMPDVISSTKSYLVVDGFINCNGVTTLKLSRTSAINEPGISPAETKATVYLEEEAGSRYRLQERTAGTYTSDNLRLNSAKRYRIHLITTSNKEYASDFVTAQLTPKIDDVKWQLDTKGINISVNTHDPANATRYYRWECEETWETRPVITSGIEYVNNKLQNRLIPYPTVCWGNEISTDIKLGSTTSLSQDVVSDYLLRSYTSTNARFRHKYSILVRQHAQTQEEYNYWNLLKKNTENIGTLFDPLPAQITGNVHCLSDDSELAFGYVGAHSIEEKRIFITRSQLPLTLAIATGYDDCIADTVVSRDIPGVFGFAGNIPVAVISGGALGTTVECVDCRLRGTTVKPAYW
jgi:hypothetical protein